MNKIALIDSKKRGKTLEGHEFGNNLLKEEVWENMMSGKDDVLMDDG